MDRSGTKESGSAFFREAAARDHLSDREGVVLPAFVSPRGFVLLWVIFLAVISVSMVAAHYVSIPVYASGPGIVFDPRGEEGSEGGVAVAVMLSPEHEKKIRSGQKVLLRLDRTSDPVVRYVTEFDPEVLSPEVARRRYAPGDEAASLVTEPVVVAIVPLGNLSDGARATEYAGSVYTADVEVESRTALSMLSEPVRQLASGSL